MSFTLDAAGNIDATTDGVNAGLSQGFGQDVLDRLTTDAGAYGTKTYTYDASGNRLTRVQGATTQTLTYTANSNRLVTHDGSTVSRDAAGNTTIDPAENVSFTYGTHNRMLSAYVGGVLKASYVYNGRGQRVKKVEAVSPNRTFVYHYGLGGELLGETVYASGGAKIGERDYLWLDSLPLAQSERVYSGGTLTGSTFVYLHADQLNTPRLATDASGTVVWRWDSDAFGVGTANLDPDGDTNQVNVRLRFLGQYVDEETGLAYNYFRDYDAVTGRYVESDPVGLDGGLNTYAYAFGAPTVRTDPLGLYTPDELANIIFNETESLSGADAQAARVAVGLIALNRERPGRTDPGIAPATLSNRANRALTNKVPNVVAALADSRAAASQAMCMSDTTSGAQGFVLKGNATKPKRYGKYSVIQQFGPLDNSAPTSSLPSTGVYMNTFPK